MNNPLRVAAVAAVAALCGCVSVVDRSVETSDTQPTPQQIVKARQAGLLPNAVLFKPFRLDQLLSTVDAVIEMMGEVPQA